jgi:integrase
LAKLEAPEDGRITIFDEHRDAPAGFCLRVGASGSKVYYLLTGLPGSAHRSWVRIGDAAAVSLDDARKAARAAAGKAALGIDLNQERQQSRAAEAAARAKAEQEQGQVTVAGLIDAYVEARKRVLSPVTAREYERTLRVDIAPSALGRLKARVVTRADIRLYHERLAKAGGPHQADRALALLKAAYRWGAGEDSSPGVSLTGDRDPSRGLLPLVRGSAKIRTVTLLDPKAKTEGDRWMGLRVFWKGTEALPPVARCFVRLLLLLGLRRGEAASARWEHVDFELGTWMLPASVRKGRVPGSGGERRELIVPLAALPIEIMGELREQTGGRGQLFPGLHVGGVGALVKSATGLKDLRLHDLRRTCASGLMALSAPPYVVSAVLGHVEPGFVGSDRHYAHGSRDEERTRWLRVWSEHVLRVVEGKEPPVVVPFREAR